MVKLLKILYWIVNVIIISALLYVHFVLKERSYIDAIRYYMFPLPVIIGIIICLSVFLSKRRYNLILAGVLLVVWLGRSCKIHIPETVKESDIEVVLWNASRDNGFEEAFKENKNIPDVLVLVESKPNNVKYLRLKYPDYFFFKSKSEIYLFSKTRIQIESETSSSYGTTVINFITHGINFYALDVTGSTDVPRTWELGFVNDIIKKNKNTIVLGDFNVPYESKNLNKLKTDFNHAFNEKGNGFRETWFWNLPLLSLDHIWVSKDLEILKTQKINTFKSDHNMIKTFIKR